MGDFTITDSNAIVDGSGEEDFFRFSSLSSFFFFNGQINGGDGIDTLVLASSEDPAAQDLILLGDIFGSAAASPVLSSIERISFESEAGRVLAIISDSALIQTFADTAILLSGGDGVDGVLFNVSQPGTYSLPMANFENWSNDDLFGLAVQDSNPSNSYTLVAHEGLSTTQYLGGGFGSDVLIGSSGKEVISLTGSFTSDYIPIAYDIVTAGKGDDIIQISVPALRPDLQFSPFDFRAAIDGGEGHDILYAGGRSSLTYSSITGVEEIHFQPEEPGDPLLGVGGRLPAELTTDNETIGSRTRLLLSGEGTLSIRMLENVEDEGASFDGSAFTFAKGSNVKLTISGTEHDDHIHGSMRDDIISAGEGDDVINGSGGRDTLDYSHFGSVVLPSELPQGLTIDLANVGPQDTGFGTKTIRNVENVVGTGFADTLFGNNKANSLSGGHGIDALIGGGGNDILSGGELPDYFIFDNREATGRDVILDFEAWDIIVTTVKLGDGDGDGIINLGSTNTVRLYGNSRLVVETGTEGEDVTHLRYDGTIERQGTNYYIYSWAADILT
jgi:Ca2+-binding RTX toxin-like protein